MKEVIWQKKLIDKMKKTPFTEAVKMATLWQKGVVDLLVVCNGNVYFFEVKLGKNTPSKLQLETLSKWSNAGAVAGVLTLDEDTQRIKVECSINGEKTLVLINTLNFDVWSGHPGELVQWTK